MKKEKILMFDVDGTIVDSFQQNFLAAQKFILDRGGPKIDEEEYRQLMIGNAWKNIFQKAGMGEKLKLTEEDVNSFYEGYEKSPLFDHIEQLLEELAEKGTLVINTSTFISHVTPIFEREGIDTFFSAYLGPEASVEKDEKIRMVMEEMGVKANDIIFVGDTGGDISEGKQAGVVTIAVTWGYNTREQLEQVQPDYLVDSIQELRELLLSLI